MDTLNASIINPNYWRRYGFNRDPFAEHTQKEFFVPNSWEEYLDLLPQFTRFCDTLLLIIGRSGVGKSTLLNLFTSQQSNDTDIFALHATDCSSAHHFLKLLNQRYGAPYDPSNSTPASEQLHQQLEFLRANKASRLLIIDAAEKLPLDMRQLCLQIIQQQNALTTCLPIILVGEDELSTQMHALLTPTTAQKCLYTIHIEPFSEDETEQYLRWCCNQAAGDKTVAFPFTPEDLANIFQQSHGVMGAINPTAQNLLSLRSKPGITLPVYLRGKILWWCGAIIIITILLIVYQQLTKPDIIIVNSAKNTPTPSATATTQAVQPNNMAPAANKAQVPTTQATPATSASVTRADPQSPPPTTPSGSTLSSTANNETQGASSDELPHSTAAPTTQPQPTDSAPTNTAQPTHPAASTPDGVKPTAVAATPEIKPTSDLFNKTMGTTLQEHHARVLHTPATHYTLQLIASANLHAVQKFILQHQLGSVALIVPTKREGKFFYIVLYGNFPTRVLAEKEQAHLRKTKHIQPWLRTYKSVQELMNRGETASAVPHVTVHKKVVVKKTTEPTVGQIASAENW